MTSLAVCSSLAAGLGLALNSYALGVLLWGHRLQTPNHLLLLHLACVDIAFCLLLLAGNATAPSTTSPIPDQQDGGSCEVQGFAGASLPILMLWSVCALSCDRYAAIASPLHYSRLVSRGKAGAFLLCSWLVGASLAAPPLVQASPQSPSVTRWTPCPYRFSRATLSCRPDCTGALPSDRIFAVFYVGLGALLPLGIVLTCSWRVLSIARSHRARIVSALYRVALSATSVVTPRPFKGRSALWTTSQLVGSLVALSAPFFGGVLWEAVTGDAAHSLYLSISTALLACAPPANAYVYGVRSRVIRRTLRHLVQRHLCKRQAIRDVEASSRRASLAVAAGRRYSAPAIGSGPVLDRSSVFSMSLRLPRQLESMNRTRSLRLPRLTDSAQWRRTTVADFTEQEGVRAWRLDAGTLLSQVSESSVSGKDELVLSDVSITGKVVQTGVLKDAACRSLVVAPVLNGDSVVSNHESEET